MENAAAVQNSSVFILLLSGSTGTLFHQINPTASPVVPTQTQTATAERANYRHSFKKKNPKFMYIERFSIFAIVLLDFKLGKLYIL